MMVKNEEQRILVSLASVKDDVDGIILFDTGSQDRTVSVARKFAKDNNLHFHLLEGEFEDFSTSRNKMLDFADTFNYDYLILLDSNDELRVSPSGRMHFAIVPDSKANGPTKSIEEEPKIQDTTVVLNDAKDKPTIRSIIAEHDPNVKAFMIHQQWFIHEGYSIDYYNFRIIKPNAGLRYKGSVHEFIELPDQCDVAKLPENVMIFQDRMADNDGKSSNRWEKDLHLLRKDLAVNPKDSRAQYYLAQTYECLNKKRDALFFYRMRAENTEGFYEERFMAALKCGSLEALEEDKIAWFLKAFEVIERAEPLVNLSRLFRRRNQFRLASTFAKLACSLSFPEKCILNVDRKSYDHDRWQELGISSYYIKDYEVGRDACQKALKTPFDRELNLKNLSFYDKVSQKADDPEVKKIEE